MSGQIVGLGVAAVMLTTICLLVSTVCLSVEAQCTIPAQFTGDYFSMERGSDLNTRVDQTTMINDYFTGHCVDRRDDNGTVDANGNFDSYLLLFDQSSACYKCYYFVYRTPNVLQYKQSQCHSPTTTEPIPSIESVCSDIQPTSDFFTYFRKTLVTVSCMNTFYGVFHFSYEINVGGGGICNHPNNLISACQEPGSQYVDNQVFKMSFAKCPDVTLSENRDVKFQCMGSWTDHTGNIWAAVADIGQIVPRQRFRCLLTRLDQELGESQLYYSMSWWSECSSLKSPYEGPVRLRLAPALDPATIRLMTPTCSFPKNYSGHWYHVSEQEADVSINATHIYMTTKIDQFNVRWSTFVCLMNSGTRYLTLAVTTGRCEIDYVCWDLMPRHQSIIRWRMAKPYRLNTRDMADPSYRQNMLRNACKWTSFTIDRKVVVWNYKTFLLNPPQPSACPLRGRYQFTQEGSRSEMYYRRYRGVTERPRHRINCKQYKAIMSSCEYSPNRLFIDAFYCETVDHTGRPIGEYDEPDWELTCVGHWTEDWNNYLITWNPEDATSKYRCWNYEYTDWRHVYMSRSSNAVCRPSMTSQSSRGVEGASLALQLVEAERQYDDCPMIFNQGGYVVKGYKSNLRAISEASRTVTPRYWLLTQSILLIAYFTGSRPVQFMRY